MAYELNNAQAVKFGDYTPALLERIKRDTRFNERPRGPLGLFLNQKSIAFLLEINLNYPRNAFADIYVTLFDRNVHQGHRR